MPDTNIAKLLTDLTRKSVPNDISWSEEAEILFNLLKFSACAVTSLSAPDTTKPYEIDTDALLTDIRACLIQRDQQDRLKLIPSVN